MPTPLISMSQPQRASFVPETTWLDATNAIKRKRTHSKINEADRYPAAHNRLVAGSSPGEPFTISATDHLHSGEGLRPGLQKFVAAIALSRGEEVGKREPLLSFAWVSNFTTHF
jgi:hypothetical protein